MAIIVQKNQERLIDEKIYSVFTTYKKQLKISDELITCLGKQFANHCNEPLITDELKQQNFDIIVDDQYCGSYILEQSKSGYYGRLELSVFVLKDIGTKRLFEKSLPFLLKEITHETVIAIIDHTNDAMDYIESVLLCNKFARIKDDANNGDKSFIIKLN